MIIQFQQELTQIDDLNLDDLDLDDLDIYELE